MSDQNPSQLGVGVATLFDSLNMQKGDLSYRMEGMCQMVSMIKAVLTNRDRKYISEAIDRACERFNQYDKKNALVTNRYALQTIADLAGY